MWLKRNLRSVFSWASVTRKMLPPFPPSPPLGPPRGTNFSRRNAMQPCPPSPALTVILASSINIEKRKDVILRSGDQVHATAEYRNLKSGFDADEAAEAAFVFEADGAGDLGEEGV